VVRPITVRLALSLAISRGWHIRQIDVQNCETLEIYNLNMQMCKPSCKLKIESGMISMSYGNKD
jgi:hypothetical protein